MNKTELLLYKILYQLSKVRKMSKGKLTDPFDSQFRAKDWNPAFQLALEKNFITEETIYPIVGRSRPTTAYSITELGKKELKKKLNEQKKQYRQMS